MPPILRPLALLVLVFTHALHAAGKPDLYVLAIGVSRFERPELTLGFPAKDAKAFISAMAQQKPGLYEAVHTRVLTDALAGKEAILGGLEWLAQEVKATDVAVVFMAGHGLTGADGQYYFLPWDADTGRITGSMVPGSAIRSALARLPGKVVLFLDTGLSGTFPGEASPVGPSGQNPISHEPPRPDDGLVVFSASSGCQPSQEWEGWGHGAFTRALLEGLSSRADSRRTGRITVNMLDVFIGERVKGLTGGSQVPITAKPANFQDFPIMGFP